MAVVAADMEPGAVDSALKPDFYAASNASARVLVVDAANGMLLASSDAADTAVVESNLAGETSVAATSACM